ncbi:MAG: tRNA uridine-5-carboxymethylaminomethyl(34) synthesis GTPase MnmE [Alphaproteobacteria bacterium]|uniref:tRNA modification GTPase MnmE n=1 Tax=Candidatus Nitrobium versatile TaxID=2884831 RepID=A0A953J394_9BACT|nr:tRNA uridine-5-carboxymethylaminomethyl(34) synthesis GTPase MnmE [Candidatus Nitrobium versatile]
MKSLDDTIAAISTPAGEGGIGIVRLSGRDAIAVAERVFVSPRGRKLQEVRSHTLVHGFIVEPSTGERVDEVLAAVMRAPGTYTREDVVEINCHGGMLPLRTTLQALLRQGARLADPGEFTRRAFLNGRIDLSQAEAVIDVIRAKTEQAERLALQQLEGRLSGKITGMRSAITGLCALVEAHIDFPEDEIELKTKDEITGSVAGIRTELELLSKGYDEGRFFREGVSTAIVGKPNVGKSSLLNALLERDRAIVTEMPGTTRDIIEGSLNINGLPLRIMDTAGIRETRNLAEKEGVRRSLRAIEGADIVIAVLDASRPLEEADREVLAKVRGKRVVVVVNKVDAEIGGFSLEDSDPGAPGRDSEPSPPVIRVSAVRGEGIDVLKEEVYSLCIPRGPFSQREDVLITTVRHRDSLDRAADSLREAESSLQNDVPLEVTALFLREALDHLGEIVGMVTTDDILNRIFDEFCIGK